MGHPDWQTYANWRSAPIIDDFEMFPPGTTSRGPFSLNNYQSLLMVVNTAADSCSINFRFFSDTTLANLVDTYQMSLALGTLQKAVLPVAGNVVFIDVQNLSGVTQNIGFVLTPVNIPVSTPVYYGPTNVISQLNTNLLASTTVDFQLPFTQPGLAHLFFNPRDNAGKLNFAVYAGSPGARGSVVYSNNGPIAGDQRLVALSDRPYFLEVINTDAAAAHRFDAVLIPAWAQG